LLIAAWERCVPVDDLHSSDEQPGAGDRDTAAADGFPLILEPDFCCGGGHCGPLPGYIYVCPGCGQETGCRTGDYLEVGETLTCYLCQRQIRATEQMDEFEYRFVFSD